MSTASDLIQKFQDRRARVAVMGLGYVGLPLAVAMAEEGLEVFGVDIDSGKVDSLARGHSYVQDVPADKLTPLIQKRKLVPTADAAVLRNADAVIICVPTPLNKTKDPDISFIIDAANKIADHIHAGMLVVLESTTFPGTTREYILPLFEKKGLACGKDFFLAFSPERIDPGNSKFHLRNTPKIVGGTTPACLEVVSALYKQFLERIVPVSGTDCAEMVKLLENTFRAVNIALVNEMAIMCHKLGLDTWEVIDAAATKPFGFMPFYPGPGLGGHCLPIDPTYLSWKLKAFDYRARFIELASDINSNMPRVVLQLIIDALNQHRRSLKGSRILLLGVAYKRNTNDLRESPAIDVLKLLEKYGAEVAYNDPFIPAVEIDGRRIASASVDRLADYDCAVICTDHSAYDYESIYRNAKILVDTRNAVRSHKTDHVRLFKL